MEADIAPHRMCGKSRKRNGEYRHQQGEDGEAARDHGHGCFPPEDEAK
jgi:hypothetical protein